MHNYNTRNKDKLRPVIAKHAYRDIDFRLVYIDKKIDVYVIIQVDMNVKYTAHALQYSCKMRDLHNFELFANAEIEQFILYLCIK